MPISTEKIPSTLIDELKNAFDLEILPCNQPLLRQGDKLEVHNLSNNLIENGLLQSHNQSKLFPRFSKLLREICTHPVVKAFLHNNEDEYKLVQTMVFHMNPKTSLHTDDIYLDSEPSGHLKGSLIAFEDFSPIKGGLGVYEFNKEEVDSIYRGIEVPKSFNSESDIYSLRGLFLQRLAEYCSDKKFITYYPKKGEIIYWDTWMPHFSVPPKEGGSYSTRFSCAAHYIPRNTEFGTRLGGNASKFAERFNASSIAL